MKISVHFLSGKWFVDMFVGLLICFHEGVRNSLLKSIMISALNLLTSLKGLL